MKKFIPVASPNIGEGEKRFVAEAMDAKDVSGTFGKFLPKFEKEFAEYCGCAYGVATSNGTTALHLALSVLGIKQGDEVIVQTLTNMATFFAVHYCGADPIPVDVEPDTLNINPSLIEEKITQKTRAIIVVHLYGHPVDMDPIMEIAKKHNLFVIEDAAEAHGAEYKGRKIGSVGDMACFSFYANKIVTTGEGGMLVTNRKDFADTARSLGSLSYGKENRFAHSAVGFNYRMSNILAAIGCAQLEKIEEIIEAKRKLAKKYNEKFSKIPEIVIPVEKSYAKNVYWMYHIMLKGKLKGRRNEVRNFLKEMGIETRECFSPYNLQPINIRGSNVKEDDCPIANDAGANGFYLPSGVDLSEGDIEYVADALIDIVHNF